MEGQREAEVEDAALHMLDAMEGAPAGARRDLLSQVAAGQDPFEIRAGLRSRLAEAGHSENSISNALEQFVEIVLMHGLDPVHLPDDGQEWPDADEPLSNVQQQLQPCSEQQRARSRTPRSRSPARSESSHVRSLASLAIVVVCFWVW